MAHAVVRTDLLHSTDVRGELVSLRYLVTETVDQKEVKTPTEIDNGHVLKIGALLEGEREVREGSAVAANTPLRDVALITTPEVMYDERIKDLDGYYNEAGKNLRGTRFHSGDIVSVTKEALDGKAKPVVGDIVELKAGTKMNVAATATSGATQVGKIDAVDVVGKYTYYAIKVD